ncbi:MAG: hypothetical protein R3352_05815 [Salinisphaeraceae bacterium]|nr:hypothetical protein [Salinisphaeraceae bacterium]
MLILKHLLMNEAAADVGGSSGGAPAAGADPVADAGTAGQPDSGSVLSQGAGEGGAENPYEFLPEKYRVFGEDESFNLEASAKKLSEGYQNLAKRLGSDEAPPESPEGYEINAENLGEEFDAQAFMQDEGTQGFLKRMHAKGMTNAQVQEVIEYGLKEWAPNLMQGEQAMTQEQCVEALKSEWQNEAEFNTQLGHAFKALQNVAGDEFGRLEQKYGNDPDFIKIMAQIGREMGEDAPPNEAGLTPSDSGTIEELMMSEAYKDAKHPQHAMVSEQVRRHFEKKYGKTPAQ